VRTYPSVQREEDTNPLNPLTTISFTPGSEERTRTGMLNATIPVFTIGLGISPQASNDTVPGYISDTESSYKYTTEFDLRNIANSSVDGSYYYAPASTDLDEIYHDVSEIIQTYGTSNLGMEQPRGIGSIQADLSSIGIPLKVNMFDDGVHGDGKANDGVYGSEWVTVNSLGTGSIIFQVEGTDRAGNVNGTQYSILLDNIQPSVSWVNTSYPPGRDFAQDHYSIYVESNCSDDETGVGQVFLDAGNIGGGDQVPMKDDGSGNDRFAFDKIYTSENVTITTGLESGIYTYTVNAYDRAGNMGSQSGNIEICNDVDIILNNLAQGDIISGNYQLITNITDPDGIDDTNTNPRFRVDAHEWFDMSIIAGTIFEGIMNTSSYADGEHTLYINAEDPYGAESTLELDFTIDNTLPEQCSIVSPVTDEYLEGLYSFKVTATDGIGIDHVNLTISNDTQVEMVSNASVGYNVNSGYYEIAYNTGNLPDGTYTLQCFGTDHAGHTRASSKLSFNIDNRDPIMNIYDPLDGQIVSGRLEFNISMSEVFLSSLAYKIDSSGWIDTSDPWDTWHYADGVHTVIVRAGDAAGHVVEESIIVTVDNHNPTCTLSLPTNGQFLQGVYTIGVIASDQGGLDSVRLMINRDINVTNNTVLNVSMSYNTNTGYFETFFDTTRVDDGNYTARVHCLDLAGNLTISENVSFQVDNNVPGLAINYPREGDVVWGNVNIDIAVTNEPYLKYLQYNIDSSGWVNVSTEWDTSLCSDGIHTMDIRAMDLSDHQTTGTITVIVDNNLPFGDIVAPNNNEYISGKYTFGVFGSDNVGVTRVVFHVFSTEFNATYNTQSSCYEANIDTSLQEEGTYFITAEIFDVADRANIVGGIQFHVDNHVPEVNINYPSEMIYLEGIVEFDVDIFDHFTSLTTCHYNVDNKGWISLERDLINSTPAYDKYRGLWNTYQLADGTHIVDVRGKDQAGHETSYTITVIVDNNRPTCEIHTPIEKQYVEDTITFKIKAIDKVGIERVVLFLFGELINASYNSQSGYYEYSFDTTTIVEDGGQSISAVAYDLSGKNNTTPTINFNIDNTPPKLEINNPHNLQYMNGTVIINATTLDSYPLPTEYNVDSAGWHDVGVPWDTNKIVDGVHTITFRARDAIGHESMETIQVTVDNHLPDCTIHSPTEQEFAEGDITFQILASDVLGIKKVILNVFSESQYEKNVEGTYNSVTNYYEYTQSLYRMEDGTYEIHVTAHDHSGKTVTVGPVEFYVDGNHPTLIIQRPINSAHLSGIFLFNISSQDTFDTKIEYNIDSEGWILYGAAGNNNWDTTTSRDGEHNIDIRVQDEAGHITERTLTVYVDNTAPVVKFVTPNSGDYLTGLNTIKTYCHDSVLLESVTMVVDQGDNRTVTTPIDVYINQITGLFEAPLDTSHYLDGEHSITIRAHDRVGNSKEATISVNFKNSGPGIITNAIPKKGEGDIEFKVNNSGNATRMFINMDSSGWREMSYNSGDNTFWYIWSTGVEDNGKHTYQIKAVDEYGNERIISDVIEIDNSASFLSQFSDALPLILFILLIIFLSMVLFLLIRNGKLKTWMKKEERGPKTTKKKGDRKEKAGKMISKLIGKRKFELKNRKGKRKGGEIKETKGKELEPGEEDVEDEFSFECPDCGADVKEEDPLCPECGVEFMEEDELSEKEMEKEEDENEEQEQEGGDEDESEWITENDDRKDDNEEEEWL